ncbi:MAG: nucleotide exchange factor GrpE, partial [Nitrosopumilus sp.]
ESNNDEKSQSTESNNDEKSQSTESIDEELSELLELEKQKVSEYEEKLKLALADFQNLNRKTQSDIENGVNAKVNEFILDFLKIYDDFVRAKEVFSENQINTEGLDSILKNMDSLLKKYNVTPIDALGEIFNPNYHEAISIIPDPDLDDNTITKEIRKGYISHQRVIRPTLVEISKKGE